MKINITPGREVKFLGIMMSVKKWVAAILLFDNIVIAVRNITEHDPVKKNFAVPNVAIHLSTYLKIIADEFNHPIPQKSTRFPWNGYNVLKNSKN